MEFNPMIQLMFVRRFLTASILAAVMTISPWSHAITILSGPSFTPAAKAPLAGSLSLTSDVPSRVSVLVSDGTDIWEKDFYDFSTTHTETLLGFKPNRTNEILVTVYDKNRNAYTAQQLLTFVTAPLPVDFPAYTVLKSEPSQMEPGYVFCTVRNQNPAKAYMMILDSSGNVVWYSLSPNYNDEDVKPLKNGNLFIPGQENRFSEINMLGQLTNTWSPPGQYPINPHDALLTDHGTILYLSDSSRYVTGLPTSAVSNAPPQSANVDDSPVVEVSATNSADVLNVWSPLDFLDPTRISYLVWGFGSGSSYGVDIEHANAVLEDTNNNSIIVSLRNQNAVFEFTRSNQLKWILSPHALWGTNWQPYLLTPEGSPFDWSYGQHGPDLTPQGTLLVYNDNNYQASPYDPPVLDQSNYSSAVEYAINDTNMTVSEVWNSAWQTNQDRLYTPAVGKTQWLPQTRNVLVTYGLISYINGVHPSSYSANAFMARIIEYTHDPIPQVVFDVSFFDHSDTNADYLGDACYRAYQIPDLYPHLPEPVADLTVRDDNQIPLLEFSADPARSYIIQASTDMRNWTTIGTPIQQGDIGEYYFVDLNADQFNARYYRVVTK